MTTMVSKRDCSRSEIALINIDPGSCNVLYQFVRVKRMPKVWFPENILMKVICKGRRLFDKNDQRICEEGGQWRRTNKFVKKIVREEEGDL
jgi:hypothetical protein